MYYVNDFDSQCIETKLKFLFLPRKCSITGKVLWLTYAYKRIALYIGIGPGEPIVMTRYYNKHAYLMAKIKDKI